MATTPHSFPSGSSLISIGSYQLCLLLLRRYELPSASIPLLLTRRTDSFILGDTGPASASNHHQPPRPFDGSPGSSDETQMARVRYHLCRQYQCLHHLDACPTSNQPNMGSPQQHLGSMRIDHLRYCGWSSEWLLYLPCPIPSYQQRSHEICTAVPNEPCPDLYVVIVRCKSLAVPTRLPVCTNIIHQVVLVGLMSLKSSLVYVNHLPDFLQGSPESAAATFPHTIPTNTPIRPADFVLVISHSTQFVIC
jgi:hypothetical protein